MAYKRKDAIWDFEVDKYHNYYHKGAIHHNSGKTQLLMALATAIALPHPQDPNYSIWPGPCDDLKLIQGKDAQTREFKQKCLALRMQGWKYKLPTNIWISKNAYPDHKEVTMRYLARGYETTKTVPPLLAGRIVNYTTQEEGIWDTVTLDSDSRVVLKAVRAGVSSYQGGAVTAIFLDEPHPRNIYNECNMRFREAGGKGRLYYGMTGVPDEDDPSIWRRIVWFRDNILILGNTNVQENIYIHAKENPHINYEDMLMRTEGMSAEEKEARLSGRIALLTGKPFFDVHILQRLHGAASKTSPLHVGTLQWSEEPDDVGNYGVYVDDNEHVEFPVTVYEFPSSIKNYVIGVDAGGGYDKTAVVVLSDEYKIVAVMHGHIDEVSLAAELVKLGKFYRGSDSVGAQIAVEMNSAGRGTNTLLMAGEEGIHRYYNLYRRPPSKYERKGMVRLQGSDIGWLTSVGNKGVMTMDGRAFSIRADNALDEDVILIPHKELLNEMSTFCYNSKGMPEAWEGSHDDLIMAWLIAIQVLKSRPFDRGYIEYPDGVIPDGITLQDYIPQPIYSVRDGQIVLNMDEVNRRLAAR